MSQEKTKVYTYTRVSTTMQIDGYSLDTQKARMKPMLTSTITRSLANMRMQANRENLLKAVLPFAR